jgi:DNA-binding LacI/PurR family transcriptional regulator
VVAGETASVVGVDDMAEAAFSRPPLSTVGVDKAWIGRQAARQVLSPDAQTLAIHRKAPVFVPRGTLRRD